MKTFFKTSGILHSADERDFKTAFSYFYEAFESYDSIDNPKAIVALKYMLMCKIMINAWAFKFIISTFMEKINSINNQMFLFFSQKRADDVNNLITGKLALKYAGKEIESMKAIAVASQKRSLAEFQKVIWLKW